jgi:glycosyltransferase involved in cell wall biosynthesis
MLVLDTGSVDATSELARAAGADVHRFDWADDFSAARNRSLELADADWNVVLDADEWLVDGGPVLAALRELAPAFVGQLRVDSEFDADNRVAIAPSWLARVLPRGARFVGRIHEQAQPGLARSRLAVRVGHDGYHQVRLPAKRGRNQRLLRLALASRPDDAYLNYQLGKDLELADCFEVAVHHYESAYASMNTAAPWRHDLVLRLLYALKRCHRWARAVALAEAETPHWRDSADYCFVLGDLWLDWALAEPARADELLPMIESSWLRCLVLGDNLDLEGAVQGRGSFLAAKNLAVFHASLGHSEQAARYCMLEAQLRGSHVPT